MLACTPLLWLLKGDGLFTIPPYLTKIALVRFASFVYSIVTLMDLYLVQYALNASTVHEHYNCLARNILYIVASLPYCLQGARLACTNLLLKLCFCLFTHTLPSGTAFADPWSLPLLDFWPKASSYRIAVLRAWPSYSLEDKPHANWTYLKSRKTVPLTLKTTITPNDVHRSYST
jgi:hypothetical protein